MSVRAYRVIKIESVNEPSFNLWHQEKVVDYLDRHSEFSMNLSESGGLTYAKVEDLKHIIDNPKDFDLEPEDLEPLKQDIEGKELYEYVQYLCL